MSQSSQQFFKQSEIIIQVDRESIKNKEIDPTNLQLYQNKKIKKITEVKYEQSPEKEDDNTFSEDNFDVSQKPKLQQSIVVLKAQINKNMFGNPIQMKIIEKAEEVIQMLLEFDKTIGSVKEGSFHFKLKKTNLSKKLSEISQEVFELYSQAKLLKLPVMTELNQMIQNMLQVEIYSKYCQDIITDFNTKNFRFNCSIYEAVEYL